MSRAEASTEPIWSSPMPVRAPAGPHRPRAHGVARRFGILSTFPPTECGIATFSAALAAAVIANGDTVDFVRCGTRAELELAGLATALDVLNRAEVAIIQHEYGLYSGPDGAQVLDVMAGITVPMILVAHTVLTNPSANQRYVLEQACDRADAVVVMTETARTRLATHFDVDPSKVTLIPHGAATPPALAPTDEPPSSDRTPRLLTWGLLGPGKGIEWAIDAIADLADLRPTPDYIIAGATHPKVLASSGQAYRQMLMHRAAASAAAGHVRFDDAYRDLPSLTELIRSADLVVLPYDSTDQVTSGVLVDAVAAGRPVVSTAFPHAVELLAGGAGLVVPQRDPAALSAAIRSVLTDPELAASMAAAARRLAPDLSWDAVARRYIKLASVLLARRQPVGR